jgi:hypothetical protein
MVRVTYSNRRREFHDHRTSWRFFNRVIEEKTSANSMVSFDALQLRILLEILKEL